MRDEPNALSPIPVAGSFTVELAFTTPTANKAATADPAIRAEERANITKMQSFACEKRRRLKLLQRGKHKCNVLKTPVHISMDWILDSGVAPPRPSPSAAG
jgi:hypothetical protein